MPRAQHRLHAGRVEDVGVAVLGQLVDVQHGRQREHPRERQVRRREPYASPFSLQRLAPELGESRRGGRGRGAAHRGVMPTITGRASRSAAPGRSRRSTPRPRRAATAGRGCCAGSRRARRARRARLRGRGSRRRPACSSPRGATARARASASSSASRAASVRARSCTAAQPADSSSRSRPSAQATVSALSDMRVEAARVLVQLRLEALVRVGEVRVAAPWRPAGARAARAHVQHPGAVRAAQPLLPGARIGVAAERVAHRPGPRRRPGRRRAARARPPPPAPPARGCRSSSRRASRRRGACAGRRRSATSANGTSRIETPLQLACGAERAQQPGVLLVARHDLIAAAELAGRRSPARCPRSCEVVSARSAVVAAERRGVGGAQLPAQLGAPFEVRRRAPLAAASRSSSCARRPAPRARAAARRCRRSDTPAARGRETRHVTRRGPQTARIPAMSGAPAQITAVGAVGRRIASAPR